MKNKYLRNKKICLMVFFCISCQPKSSNNETLNIANEIDVRTETEQGVINSEIDIPFKLDTLIIQNDVYQSKIENYEMCIGELNDSDNNNFIILRKFTVILQDSVATNNYLGVNINTLETILIKSDYIYERSWNFLFNKYCNSNYIKLCQYVASLNKEEIYNSGLTNISNIDCYAITTDLCPSTSKIEYDFYDNYNKMLSNTDSVTLPIGIAISGLWIIKHKSELAWLIEREKASKFTITWINHSFNHKYIKGYPLSDNFLLIENTDIEKEVLATEQTMIQYGLTPSIYFRFPGLVSNQNLYRHILDYGLIPLGSDSWIAKGQFPKKGSIVLLHGNGNETIGITMFLNWIKKNRNQNCIMSINKLCIRYFENNK